ncbi:MAG: hypothetical protein N3G78_10025 [Desulfobacterota bacterium]|nr:hypothetical protein [Thermodesulfobacteriota bacterium]
MKWFKATALALLILLGLLFLYVVEDLPEFGDPGSPAIRAVKLFDLPLLSFDTALDQGKPPEALLDALRQRGFPLPVRIEKVREGAAEWIGYIPKEEIYYDKEEKYYWIVKEGQELRIFRYAFVVRWFEKGLKETEVPNMVTHGLADYRGYDTLGETVVIFTAGVSVILLLRRQGRL